MAKIKLSEGFSLIPKGEQIFKITKSTYDEDFGKLEVEMITKSGQKHIERFSLIGNDGEINEGAQNAFSYFAKTALNDYTLDEIDTDDIVGCYIKCTVEHDVRPHRDDPNKTVTFIRLAEKYPADGFDEVEKSTKKGNKPATKPAAKVEFNLDDILG